MRRNRSSARTVCKAIWLVPLLAFACVTAAVAPAVQAPTLNPSSARQQGPFSESGDSGPFDVEKQMRRLNDDRHKTIVSDTNKLVKLTQELDSEIAANSSDTLTPEELHKLATIEKLAHSVLDDRDHGHVLNTVSELANELKDRAAKARLAYDGRAIAKALDSAHVQRSRR